MMGRGGERWRGVDGCKGDSAVSVKSILPESSDSRSVPPKDRADNHGFSTGSLAI